MFLPVIIGIPDDLTDLTALRDLLIESNGKVSVESEDAARDFSEKFENLKIASKPIVEEHSSLVERLKVVEAAQGATSLSITASRSALASLIAAEIVVISEVAL